MPTTVTQIQTRETEEAEEEAEDGAAAAAQAEDSKHSPPNASERPITTPKKRPESEGSQAQIALMLRSFTTHVR